jgi:hypothetical protein
VVLFGGFKMKKTFCDICGKELESKDLFPFDGLPIKLNKTDFSLKMVPFDITKDFCNLCVLKAYIDTYTQYTLGRRKTKRNQK